MGNGGMLRDGGGAAADAGPRPGGKGFFGDLVEVLFAPATFWERGRSGAPADYRPIWIHLLVLIGLRAVSGFGGALLRGAGVGAAFGQLFSGLIAAFALVWLFAAIVAGVTAGTTGRTTVRDAFRFAAYGLTPLFVVGVLAVVPLPYVAPIADLVLMPYTFYVLGVGVVPALGVPVSAAPGRVALICGSLLVLWSVMPTLIPLVVEAIVR